MISGHTESESIVGALQQGASDYVTKPIQKEIALSRIENAMALSDFHQLRVEKEQADTLKDMICTYNHELNNPLMIAMAAAEMGNKEKVIEAIQRAADIVHKIGKLSSGKVSKEDYIGDGRAKLVKLS